MSGPSFLNRTSSSGISQAELPDELRSLLRLTQSDATPNINALNEILRDMTAMKFNIKFFGYEMARKLAEQLPPAPTGGPYEIDLLSKPSTQADLEAEWTRHWTAQLGVAHVFHRKLWELAYVLQVIWQSGKMAPGKRGLGFGCGEEPLPSYLAAQGCHITVTDLPPEDQRASGWATTAQLASLDKAYKEQFIDRATYEERVDFRYVDMTAIPDDVRGYDFCWSICAFEHLGSIEKGISFIENSMEVLAPGGVSVHTTEFNFMDNNGTIDNWPTVLFQKQHFQEMARRLEAKGYEVAPLNFDIGNDPMDKFIDIPPYAHDWNFDQAKSWEATGTPHVKLAVDGFLATCFGIIAHKP
jgi:2-polyprenyl-3-methyl-5-hydroxy-6-metoxy-1,4-benzoquinol methylase